ncbi:hypothetical protein EBU94_07980 [bacterium]|nr:hypothetical protein [bacterium]
MQLPTLYKKTATGATQEWTIFFEGREYYTISGQVDGKKITSTPTKCVNKNVGNVNETTPEQQAEREARAKWQKKMVILMKKGRMNSLYEKIAKKTGLSKHDINGILKVTSYELVEILKEEQRFYWDGLGLFFVNIKDTGLSVRIKLSEETYERLNIKKEKSDEIIFE